MTIRPSTEAALREFWDAARTNRGVRLKPQQVVLIAAALRERPAPSTEAALREWEAASRAFVGARGDLANAQAADRALAAGSALAADLRERPSDAARREPPRMSTTAEAALRDLAEAYLGERVIKADGNPGKMTTPDERKLASALIAALRERPSDAALLPLEERECVKEGRPCHDHCPHMTRPSDAALVEASSNALTWIENYPLNRVYVDDWGVVADDLRAALADARPDAPAEAVS